MFTCMSWKATTTWNATETMVELRPHSWDITRESVDWGAPGEARHAWKGKLLPKFFIN